MTTGQACLELDGPVHEPVRRAREAASAPVVAPVAAQPLAPGLPAYCQCPIGTRPRAATNGRCPLCGGSRTAPVQTARTASQGTLAAPAELAHVQTSPSTATGTAGASNATPAPAPMMGRRDMVAGAAAAGEAILLAFRGRGELARKAHVSAIVQAGFPAALAPKVKSCHAHAARALETLQGRGYVVRADRSRGSARLAQRPLPTWSARWTVIEVRHGSEVGTVGGSVYLTAELHGDELRLEGPSETCAAIQASYRKFVDGEIYDATDVSSWLRSTMISEFRAAPLGGCWYVKRRYAAAAERLVQAMAGTGWGQDFMLPGLPVATTDQLKAGIALGLRDEVNTLIDEYREARDHAAEERKTISSRAATALHDRLTKLAERVASFGVLLGEHHTRPLRDQLVKASEEIQEHMSGISIRFGLIFDELRRDAAAKESE